MPPHVIAGGRDRIFWGEEVPAGQENMVEGAVQCFQLSGSLFV